jgi:hypothetical protein
MPNANDEPKGPTGSMFDRRTVIRSALVVGGVSALGGGAAAIDSQAAVVSEHEWARTLARQVSVQLPEAARQVPGLCLTADQIEELRAAFENTLVTNMGCGLPTRS